ncbi:DegT/DnrJ/EryC1/StrS family aminotransferase [Candidatus Pelagibacter bacterium]|nr:DegT/DnrJ/EryC1/StrS family aminotransferase [Candidatus Pelagibacter bacterium]
MISFWSYKREYKKINRKILKKIDQVLLKGNIFFGSELKKFEKNFLLKYSSKYGIAVGSGTDALYISLKAINIKNGDEVITAANTAIPTISAIVNAGAKPKLVDVGEDYLIDPLKIEKQINKKTKAIIPVHLYGQSCDMDKIKKIAIKHNLKIIEDCAQAQGAKYKNKFVGNFGDFGCFSFYPTKILGTYGDGGFVIAKNFKDYEKIKRLRFYGIETSNKKNIYFNQYYANENGLNSRLDEIQSSILNLKIKNVDNYIFQRKRLANLYLKYLKGTSLKLPNSNETNQHVYHLFTVRHSKRNFIMKMLNKKKIGTRIIYPFPINGMNAYKKFNFNNSELKNTIKYSKEIFSLPLHPEIKVSEIKKICDNIKNILKKIN